MRPISAQEALDIWERGQNRDLLNRALILLSSTLPAYRRDQLAELSIGQRDGLLLDLYEHTFGRLLHAKATCPRCGATLKFDLDSRELAGGAPAPPDRFGTFEIDNFAIEYRLPSSADLEILARARDVRSARDLLLDRCVLSAHENGEARQPSRLPQTVLDHLAERMEEHDPLAEIPLNVDCPKCHHAWQLLFDASAFLWSRLSSIADRLLYEVHTLARAYGWTEPEILALTPARRSYYMKRVPKA